MSVRAQKLDAPKLPVQVCAGRLGKVGEAKESSGGHYYVLPLEIAGQAGSPDAKVWFLWRPEFFQGNIKETVAALPTKDESEPGELTRNSFEFVYGKNIISDDTSLLAAITGTEENFDKLFDAVAATDCEPSSVEGVFKEFFAEEQPLFFFTRQQQREKTDDGDERRKNGYEVGRFFLPTDTKSLKYYAGKVKTNPEYEQTYDPDLLD